MGGWRDSLAAMSVVLGLVGIGVLTYFLASGTADPFALAMGFGIAAQVTGVFGIWSQRRGAAAAGIILGTVPAIVFVVAVFRLA